jgi:sarcosine oxidase subunit gamma
MSEAILRESPLAHLGLAKRATAEPGSAGVIVRELPFLGHINLRGDPKDPHFAGAVGGSGRRAADGAEHADRAARHHDVLARPDEWLIVTPDDQREQRRAALRQALRDAALRITDVSGGQTTLHLHGRHVRDVLAKGCPIDFHPRVFGIGPMRAEPSRQGADADRQIEEQPYFELIVRRSFADYLWTWLEGAAEEYGLRCA